MKKLIMLFFALATVAGVEAQTVYIAPSKSAIAYHKSKDCSYLKNSVNVTAIKQAEAKDMGRHACVRCYPEQKEQTLKNIAKEKQTKKTTTAAEKKTTTTAQTVYITSAKSATAYHKNKDCTYLKKAADIQGITAAKAKELNRVPCKVCYPTATSAAKKTTTAAKKTTTTTKKETTAAKKKTTATTKTTPARDEKGRFVKKTTEENTTTTKKSTPARDEKGRFVKKTTEENTTTTKKSTPARDEKGRFIKKTDTETKTTTKKTTKKAA